MKHNAIVCNIGHFRQRSRSPVSPTCQWEEIKPQVDHVIWPSGKRMIILARAAL